MSPKTEKLYCYVDETGQDTKGDLFIVVTIITTNKTGVEDSLRAIEEKSGVRKKWRKTHHERRMNYLEEVAKRMVFRNLTFVARFPEAGKAYVDLTIFAVAKALKHYGLSSNQRVLVVVDGLRKNERMHFAAGLRKLEIKVAKVQGGREQSGPILRLADMVAGLTRDHTEGKHYTDKVYHALVENKILTIV